MDTGVLQFTCIPGCTACCEQKGWVYVTESDVERAASFLALSKEEFEQRYVVRTRHRLRLRKPKDAQCHFLRQGGCSIHPVKPVQCRLFPFWPELVSDRGEWRKTGGYCPGIGQGPLIQIGTALETAQEMETAYPALYPGKEL
ncbi:MAG: YkgJ family cysteine cluster protein [Acidobacteria bacterium]|nr:YkgJ family cysteine cluster protein [Acidobacteriota bacterium]